MKDPFFFQISREKEYFYCVFIKLKDKIILDHSINNI